MDEPVAAAGAGASSGAAPSKGSKKRDAAQPAVAENPKKRRAKTPKQVTRAEKLAAKADKKAPPLDEAVAGFSQADLDNCVRILGIMKDNDELYNSPPLRPLRLALTPLVELQRGKFFRGMTEGEWSRRQAIKREKRAQAMRLAKADKEKVNQRALRKKRLEAMTELENQGKGEEPLLLIPDGTVLDHEATDGTAAVAIAAAATASDDEDADNPSVLRTKLRSCYTCKSRFHVLHSFYDQLCPECAELNWTKRHQTADLKGMVAIVTGARVKIGYRITLKLLRCGATVMATTRFPHDAAARYVKEEDFGEWSDRLHIIGLDLRDNSAIEGFLELVQSKYDRLDIIINNACQTIRRPPAYYAHMIEHERKPVEALGDKASTILRTEQTFRAARAGPSIDDLGVDEDDVKSPAPTVFESPTAEAGGAGAGSMPPPPAPAPAPVAAAMAAAPAVAAGAGLPLSSAEASQVALIPEDHITDKALFPSATDINNQQIDLRKRNSWVMRMHEISTPELAEVFAINALAPFIINSRLKHMMTSPFTVDGVEVFRDAFIVNVSAMEGKFYRYKSPNHPHTNMAKAALNMMTRTSAEDYSKARIFMTAVDTGWINDENPLEKASRIATKNNFQTPLDEEDAAARVLDPVLHPVSESQKTGTRVVPPFGKFLKDYHPTEW